MYIYTPHQILGPLYPGQAESERLGSLQKRLQAHEAAPERFGDGWSPGGPDTLLQCSALFIDYCSHVYFCK